MSFSFGGKTGNAAAIRATLKSGGDIVLGDSPDAVKYLKANQNCLMWGTSLTAQRYKELKKSGICVIKAPLCSKSVAKKLSRKAHNVIVFRDGGYSYSELVSLFGGMKKSAGAYTCLHLEADRDESFALREKIISESKTGDFFVNCFDKNEFTARRFIADYPVSAFVPRSFFNENCTLKSEKEINVAFIGFDSLNYEIFRLCAMQFQFAGQKDGKLYSKPVHYYVFDADPSRLSNEAFSLLSYEFDQNFSHCDFPKPDMVCDLKKPTALDLNSEEGRKTLKSLVSENSFTFFILSPENSFGDAACAKTLARLLRDCDNYRIFARAKDSGLVPDGDKTDDKIICFGGEKLLYSRSVIVGNYLTELARRINLSYNSESGRGHDGYMLAEWEKRPAMERYANVYNALSIPFKLGLLGFKAVSKQERAEGVTEEEFNARYVNSGRESGYGDYSYYFKTESGNVLAFCEHARWNAHYILFGYVQMSKEEMKNAVVCRGDGRIIAPHKNTPNKKHACLTTYEGLDDLIRYKYSLMHPNADLTALSPTDETLCSLGMLYAFDYMDLDRLYGILQSLDYSVIKIY